MGPLCSWRYPNLIGLCPKAGDAGSESQPLLRQVNPSCPRCCSSSNPSASAPSAAALPAEGLLLGVNSLGSAAKRLSKRDGGTQVWDGPFAEAKEMVGGYFLLDTEDPAVALAWAERCPAAEWATVEIRGVGPCYL